MIEGGKHGNNNLCTQEFSVITSLENGKKIWQKLKNETRKKEYDSKQGLEGGLVPALRNDEEAIKLIISAITSQGLKIPADVKIGLDIAANNCHKTPKDILDIFNRFPIYSLEDPLDENSWEEWSALKIKLDAFDRDYLLVGDDLFTTNQSRFKKGIDTAAGNGIIIKPNQVGTLWETLEVIAQAAKAGFVHILSHRSGETTDSFIADLACATAAKYIKSGAPFALERAAKYNRLEEIKKEII